MVEYIHTLISESKHYVRDDYLELLQLAGRCVGIKVGAVIRKPGAMHHARWMAKAIYTLKMLLMHTGNEVIMNITAEELSSLKRVSRFICTIYLQSWYTSSRVVDAPYNDLLLLERLKIYDDSELSEVGVKMMLRHSWYLSPEVATLILFSDKIDCGVKCKLLSAMTTERGTHRLKMLPGNIYDLKISRAFFTTTRLDDAFLETPPAEWDGQPSYHDSVHFVNNLTCINDCAERGIALIQQFNSSTKNEAQRQYLLQVVEHHRRAFSKSDLTELSTI